MRTEQGDVGSMEDNEVRSTEDGDTGGNKVQIDVGGGEKGRWWCGVV